MTRRGETDAILRRILGYGRVFDDPTEDRVRMGVLILQGFRDLHTRLTTGEPLPEAWDSATRHAYRDRTFSGPVHYVYPPGSVGPAPCTHCAWIDPRAPVTACMRCHTIRFGQRG